MSKYSLQVPTAPSRPLSALSPAPAYARASAFLWDTLPALLVFYLLCRAFLPSLSLNPDPSMYTSPTPMWEVYSWLASMLRWAFVSWLFYALWNIGFEALYSTTPGKYLVGLRVVATSTPQSSPVQSPLGWKSAFFRFLCASFSWLTFNIGHAMGHWRADKSMLHDILCRYRVVEDPQVSLPSLPQLPRTAHRAFRVLAWVIMLLFFAYKILVFLSTLSEFLNSMAV